MSAEKGNITITVVIPAFNAERFLPVCLESVLRQTHPANEILIVDDASSDKTYSIASECAQKHPGLVRVLQHDGGKNKGAAASRNLGIRNAGGTHIAFLDADDIWLPDKLGVQYRSMLLHPSADLFYAKASIIDANGAPATLAGFSVCGRGRQGIIEGAFEKLLSENFVVNSTSLVRKEALLKAELFSEDILSYEDWLVWLKIAAFGTVHFDSTVLACYRVHSGGKLLAAQKNRIGPQREAALIADLYTYLRNQTAMPESEIERYLKQSINRVLLRARSLMFSNEEMRMLHTMLCERFQDMRTYVDKQYRNIMLLPAPLLSLLRRLRRILMKV